MMNEIKNDIASVVRLSYRKPVLESGNVLASHFQICGAKYASVCYKAQYKWSARSILAMWHSLKYLL